MTPKRIVTALIAALAAALLAPAAAGAAKPIHPGIQTYTKGGQCTANFVFKRGKARFIGQAAHCSSTGAANETDGCLAKSRPLGTTVSLGSEDSRFKGRMVYNSWLAMQKRDEKNANACAFNDLALVKIKRKDHKKISPNIPAFGGPTGIGSSSASFGDSVYTFGNSSLRGGAEGLGPKQGIVFQSTGGGWSREVYTVTPGIPGDSGSAFLDENGKAIGILSTLQLAPTPAANGVSDARKTITYARKHGMRGLKLVKGKAFDPGLPGLDAPPELPMP